MSVKEDEGLSFIHSHEINLCIREFQCWTSEKQLHFVNKILAKMTFSQQSEIFETLKPLLLKDFVSELAESGLSHIAERILRMLDAKSLKSAELVSTSWYRIIDQGYLWKNAIEHRVVKNPLWLQVIKQCDFHSFLSLPSCVHQSQALTTPNCLMECQWHKIKAAANFCDTDNPIKLCQHHKQFASVATTLPSAFYRSLFHEVEQIVQAIENRWKQGEYRARTIQCRNQNSRGVYCIQYDDSKIVAGLRDNTIRVWKYDSDQCVQVLRGHSGSVLCLQYDDHIIVSGSSDSTIRVWTWQSQDCVNCIQHHSDAVLHLRFSDQLLVTCSKDRTIAVWHITSPTKIRQTQVLQGHRAAVNVIEFDTKYIVSASGDRTIKVWPIGSSTALRTLTGHKRGIACLHYHHGIAVSGSSDNTIRIWNIETAYCLRVLEGHNELVRCIRFNSQHLVSGSYDGEIRVWDMKAALNPHVKVNTDIGVATLWRHSSRVFRLQIDEQKIVSSSHDDSIIIWDFGLTEEEKTRLHSVKSYYYQTKELPSSISQMETSSEKLDTRC